MGKIIAQKAVLQKNGRFLIVRRSPHESAFPNLWDFPGGKLEVGENNIASVKREVKEEIGLSIVVADKLREYNAQYKNTSVHFIIYAATTASTRIKIGHEHSGYRWATPQEIAELPAMPFMEDFLKEYAGQTVVPGDWELLVEREGDYWKNYIMVSSIDVTKKEFGCTLTKHITTRVGTRFTHWRSLAGSKAFAEAFLSKIKNNKVSLEKLQKLTSTRQKNLQKNYTKIEKLITTDATLANAANAWGTFSKSYLALYPPFLAATYLDSTKKTPPKTLVVAARIRFDCRVIFGKAEAVASSLFQKIAKKIKIDPINLGYCTPQEITDVCKQKKITDELRQKIETRKKFCVLQYDNNRMQIFTGDAAKAIIQKLQSTLDTNKKTISGTVAYRGVVSGIARIVKNAADFKKIHPGCILVTPMTTALFTPILSKVAGIITDEGGLTCHAALLAREFKKPCLIGTHRATREIFDGQHITLRANDTRGTVEFDS